MSYPSRRITKEFLENIMGSIFMSGRNIHPNNSFYKYYWWIYTTENTEADASFIFYRDEHRLCTYDFMEKTRIFDELKIKYAYVNIRAYRIGTNIFNYDALKSKIPAIEFAPTFEDDRDPIWKGHK